MVNYKKYISYLSLCLIAVLCMGISQPPSGISVKISSPAQEYAVGDPIEININISLPATYHVQWSHPLPQIKNMEEADSMRLDSSIANNVLIYHQRTIIQAFDTGNFKIPPIRFNITKPGDTVHYMVSTDTLNIKVIGVTVDPQKDIKPLKPPILLPDVFNIPWLYIIIGAIVLLLAITGWILYRRGRKKPRLISPEQKKSAYERAMEALKVLEKDAGSPALDVKVYYTALSDITRRYLYEAFDIPAPERTTSGTLRAARVYKFQQIIIQLLTDLLKRADLVKFAKFHPNTQHSQEDFQKTRKLINDLHLAGHYEEKKL